MLGHAPAHDRIGIFGAAIGAVIGAFLHLGDPAGRASAATAVRIRSRLALRIAGLHEFLRLMLPKMLSHPIEPLTFLFFTSVATTLVAGSVTAVSFARNFQSVPVSADRRRDLAGGLPGAVDGLGGRRPTRRSGGSCGRTR